MGALERAAAQSGIAEVDGIVQHATKYSAEQTPMKSLVTSITIAVLFVFGMSTISNSQSANPSKPKELTSNQALMRDKLVRMNRILEGITLDRFDQVEESAKTLGMIGRATSWHIADPTPQYERLSKNFQEQTADLARHAKERNVEAATLDLVRMNITCTHCHQHMREVKAKRN